MGSVDNDPRLTQSLVDDCLPYVLTDRQYEHPQPVRKVGEEAFFRQGESIGPRLAPLVEEATKGRLTVRRADPAIHGGLTTFTWAVYFVRCELREGLPEYITTPTDDMVLYVINPHRGMLTIGAPMRSAEDLAVILAERELAREQEQQQAAEAARLREEADAYLTNMFGRLEMYVEQDGRHSVRQDWWAIQRKGRQSLRDVPLGEVVMLCYKLGIDLTHLANHPAPATP